MQHALLVVLALLLCAVVLCNASIETYVLSLKGIFLVQAQQNKIVTVTRGGKAYKFLGSLSDDHWIHKETGQVWRKRKLKDGFDNILPDGRPGSRVRVPKPGEEAVSNQGIYPIGMWPLCKPYRVRCKWNEWERHGNKAGEGNPTAYEVTSVDEERDSIPFQHTVVFSLENILTLDGWPVDVIFTSTTRITDTMKANFGLDDNDWFPTLDAKSKAAAGEFIRSTSFTDLRTLQHEEGKYVSDKKKATYRSFISKMFLLNVDPRVKSSQNPHGNEGIPRTIGREIVVSSLVYIDIAKDAKNRNKLEENLELLAMTENAAKSAERNAQADANIERTRASGRADGMKKMIDTIGDKNFAEITLAEIRRDVAIEIASKYADALKETNVKVLGNGVIPMFDVGDITEKDKNPSVEKTPGIKKAGVK